MTARFKWPEEHTQALKDYVALELSYAEIEIAINEKFGTSYTRNALIGRAGRIGISNTDRTKIGIRKSKGGEHRAILRIRAMNGNSNHLRIHRTTASAEARKLRCIEIIPRNIVLMDDDFKDGVCKYPYGDGPIFTFCGHPSQKGSRYCVPHHHVVYVAPTPSKSASLPAWR